MSSYYGYISNKSQIIAVSTAVTHTCLLVVHDMQIPQLHQLFFTFVDIRELIDQLPTT